MITSVFKKSTPLNFVLVLVLMLVFFLLYHFQDLSWTNSHVAILKTSGLFVLLFCSVFITDFVTKKNGLSKDSCYTIFFYFLFLLFFPSVLDNTNLIVANFFILLAIRRLISLQTLKSSREKIFDASLWIFLATLFHFWSILFILLVFISIIFHAAKDYRYWVLPFIAFFVTAIIVSVFTMIFEVSIVEYLNSNAILNLKLDYFTNNYQNAAFSIYITITLFFVVSMLASITDKPLLQQASYKKILTSFFIGIIVFVVSDDKSNDLLLFTFVPMSIMATSHIEKKQIQLNQELVLGILILCSMFAFFSQL